MQLLTSFIIRIFDVKTIEWKSLHRQGNTKPLIWTHPRPLSKNNMLRAIYWALYTGIQEFSQQNVPGDRVKRFFEINKATIYMTSFLVTYFID